ncbi:Glucose-1-phosphate thymidylyltransferase [Meiothermus luteus]|jgi:glucose-1-phosphate thymidylyltransferase|uniref:Glucose-1-phosphate thymidylyltransferase n=1 Tax=Meiothermus luteus TaxID=2026184 RepID=A0A399EFC7_9DEIN|nr:glucose-1-phosphate thymidylyltransferase [Meiothermus luteus]RIH83327.1 Glucose-1-phosphate thymidylyltransferase [Meiothermus luteus]
MELKGLVLSGGKGTRLRPLTHTRAKQLIPIAGKPNLFYAIEDLVAAGIRDIGVVLSPETGDEVRSALGDGTRWGARFTFIVQEAPLGIAHAVKTARPFLGEHPFVLYLGDNLLSGGIRHLVAEYQATNPAAIVLLCPVDDPRAFGVVALDEVGRVVRLVEKPQDPPSNLALVGVYLFSPAIHPIIEGLRPSGRGEYEITEAIQGLVDRGQRVVAHQVRGWWKDTGKPEDLLDANRLALSQVARRIEGELLEAKVIGEVVVEPGAKIVRSTVRGPAYIGAGALIEDGFVGPYTAIGKNARVIASEVEYSILMDEAQVYHLPYRLDSSVLGQGVVVDGKGNTRRHTLQLVLGDRSRVML